MIWHLVVDTTSSQILAVYGSALHAQACETLNRLADFHPLARLKIISRSLKERPCVGETIKKETP
jgi:hypothetical protein